MRGLPGVVVVASHDRMFLDEVCTDIVDLDPTRSTVTRYGGAYTGYLAAKRRERIRWEEQYAAEQEELEELREAVRITARAVNHARTIKDNNKIGYDRHGGRVQRQISRRVRNAQQRLDELTRDQLRRPPAPLTFAAKLTGLPTGERIAVALSGVTVGGRLSIDRLDVSTSERLMVTGPNGAGKSTLLQVIAGRLTPDGGEMRRTGGVKVGLLEQEVAFPDDELTARQVYDAAAGADAVSLARLGLLAPGDVDRPLGHLSVGQRRRLALALLVATPPDVLLLDEPTNHLSLSLVEELEDALRTAAGAVVVASHDRWLRRGWEGSELSLVSGKIV